MQAKSRGDLAGRLATTLNKSLKKAARTRYPVARPQGRANRAGFSVSARRQGGGRGASRRMSITPIGLTGGATRVDPGADVRLSEVHRPSSKIVHFPEGEPL